MIRPRRRARRERAAQVEDGGARLREVRVDRVELVDAGEQCGLRTAHERAFGDLGAAGATGDRRGDGGVVQVESRRGELGAALGDVRRAVRRRAVGGVVLLLAERLLRDEPLIALDVLLGVGEGRLGARERGRRRADLRAQRTRVDGEQRLAGTNVGALGVEATLDDPLHAGPYLGGADGLQPARQLDRFRDRLSGDDDDSNFGWRRRRGRRSRLRAGRQEQGGTHAPRET